MVEQRELTMDDYLAILRRRWLVLVLPTVLGPIIAYGISLTLRSLYTSQTLVLVEGQKVPDSFVKPVVTEELTARLGTMQEQILSRTRLQPIIERYGLFKSEAPNEPMEDLVDRMRKAIELTPVRSVVSSRQGDLPGFAIAVTLDNARMSQQVCAEITSMFIGENLHQREQSAQGTTSFLESQLQDAMRNLDEQETKLAAFKRKHMGSLPEETQTNFNLLNSLSAQLEAATQALNRAQQDKAYTESLLNQQIAAWKALQQVDAPHSDTLRQQLTNAENTLRALEARYTEGHPDVVKLKAAIEDMKKRLEEPDAAAPQPSTDSTSAKKTVAEPASLQQLRGQYRAYTEAVNGYARTQQRLDEQIKLYESRVQLSPAIEQEYRQVTRDYRTALEFYDDLLRKKDQSAMATDLERRQEGEQFRILDPANLPEKPSFPNRPEFALVGLGAGVALGLGLTALFELSDKTLRTERDIESYLGLPTLAVVPVLEMTKRKVWKNRSRGLAPRSRNKSAAV
jgi:protein tyrosine kinase modulator